MKQLSQFFPAQLSEFDEYSNNISFLGSTLQNRQFLIVEKMLADGSTLAYKNSALSWSVDQQLSIVNTSSSFDVAVFDYVTRTAQFKSSLKSELTFPI